MNATFNSHFTHLLAQLLLFFSVRHRNKFVKATKSRKGAVLDVRSQAKRYTGETVGIRTDIAKSTRLK